MFYLIVAGEGFSMGDADICKTPPEGEPIPYPNMAQLCQMEGFAENFTIAGQFVGTLQSTIPMSTGDEAGELGGVISEEESGECKPMEGSELVLVNGEPAQHTGVAQSHNSMNYPEGAVPIPPQLVTSCQM
ncbi:DUF4150 domain-containing protein [Francisella uliginis]|uniref:Uncharacterized protein n=1 Tax=Francisella uliginis TaxID=573570 RepID=A0A1L4BTQ8_9GAMM|nr:DUF4150 domain-containing protein [Francisella uliginis]API87215.1 hypothetical protein F7310_07500 [Francisella uliginis]